MLLFGEGNAGCTLCSVWCTSSKCGVARILASGHCCCCSCSWPSRLKTIAMLLCSHTLCRHCGQPSPQKPGSVVAREAGGTGVVDTPQEGVGLHSQPGSRSQSQPGGAPQGSSAGGLAPAGMSSSPSRERQLVTPSRSAASAALASRVRAPGGFTAQPPVSSATKGTPVSSRARLFSAPSAVTASPSRLVQQAMQPPLMHPLSPAEKREQASLSESAAAAAQLSALSVTSPFSAQILARLEELEARTAELRRSLHTPSK
jgi:hypothetical protein